MKKKMVLDLIKYHTDGNDNEFRRTAYEIAKEFDRAGDYELGEYITGLLSSADTLSIQSMPASLTNFVNVPLNQEPLPLPRVIQQDLIGVANAILHRTNVHKFLFEGAPGTGKTESAKQLARMLGRELLELDAGQLVDSRLGQTAKNIADLFAGMNTYPQSRNVIFLFDEIDALALDRVNSHDMREMGRATSSLLRGMDSLNKDVAVIATTNLYNQFDKALIRRFDATIHFDRYSREDLLDAAEAIFDNEISKYKGLKKDGRFLQKILSLIPDMPMPGELKNNIKTSLAFSSPGEELGYMRRLFYMLVPQADKMTPADLKKAGFTVRQIGILMQMSKSSVSRELGGE